MSTLKVNELDTKSGTVLTVAAGKTLDVTLANDAIGAAQIATDAVTADAIAANAVTSSEIVDDAVTLAKMADGTQGGIIHYGAAGAPTQLAAGTSGYYLKTQGAAANPVWAAVTIPDGYPSDAWTFRLTTGFNGGQDPVTNGFTKIQYLGSDTFADPSTGVFTFPSTGIWYIRWQTSFSNNSSYYQSITIHKTPDDSTYTTIGTGYGATRDSNEPAGIATITAFFDVTDVTTHKCKFGIGANNAGMSTLGSATSNNTYIEFTKVGAT